MIGALPSVATTPPVQDSMRVSFAKLVHLLVNRHFALLTVAPKSWL